MPRSADVRSSRAEVNFAHSHAKRLDCTGARTNPHQQRDPQAPYKTSMQRCSTGLKLARLSLACSLRSRHSSCRCVSCLMLLLLCPLLRFRPNTSRRTRSCCTRQKRLAAVSPSCHVRARTRRPPPPRRSPAPRPPRAIAQLARPSPPPPPRARPPWSPRRGRPPATQSTRQNR